LSTLFLHVALWSLYWAAAIAAAQVVIHATGRIVTAAFGPLDPSDRRAAATLTATGRQQEADAAKLRADIAALEVRVAIAEGGGR